MKFYRYQGFGLSGLSNVASQGIHQLNPSTKEQTTKMFKFSDKGLGSTSKINSQAQDPVMSLPNLKKDVMPVSKFSYKTDDGKVIEDHEFKAVNLDSDLPSDSQIQSSENKLTDLANKIKPSNHSYVGPKNFSVGHKFVEEHFDVFGRMGGSGQEIHNRLNAYNLAGQTIGKRINMTGQAAYRITDSTGQKAAKIPGKGTWNVDQLKAMKRLSDGQTTGAK